MARRPWLYSEGGENQIGGFVKEFTNIAFLTVKVGLRGLQEMGTGLLSAAQAGTPGTSAAVRARCWPGCGEPHSRH